MGEASLGPQDQWVNSSFFWPERRGAALPGFAQSLSFSAPSPAVIPSFLGEYFAYTGLRTHDLFQGLTSGNQSVLRCVSRFRIVSREKDANSATGETHLTIWTHTHTHTRMHMRTSVCICVCVYMYMCVCICVYTCAYVCMHVILLNLNG